MRWRRLNYALHRDIGYLCVGLTLIYAVSGIAVNHIHDWNPSYIIERVETNIGPVLSDPALPVTATEILRRLDEKGSLESSFRPAPNALQLFVDGRSILVDLTTGNVIHDKATPRPLLHTLNALHLNHPRKLWTGVADIYAVALGFLALSGVLMIRHSTRRRGILLTTLGAAVPLLFALYYG